MLTYLVYVVVLNYGVKASIQVIEEVNDLHRRGGGRESREADNVWEVDRDLLERLGYYWLAVDQLGSYRSDKDNKKYMRSLPWYRARNKDDTFTCLWSDLTS